MFRSGIVGSYPETTLEIYLIPSFPSQGSNADPEIRQVYPPHRPLPQAPRLPLEIVAPLLPKLRTTPRTPAPPLLPRRPELFYQHVLARLDELLLPQSLAQSRRRRLLRLLLGGRG